MSQNHGKLPKMTIDESPHPDPTLTGFSADEADVGSHGTVEERVLRLTQAHLDQYEARRQALAAEITQLEGRRDRLQKQLRSDFAGLSQEVAIHVQGFRDYLINSLQELVTAAEELKLVPASSMETNPPVAAEPPPAAAAASHRQPQFAAQTFAEEAAEIRELIDQYRNTPDYYGPPWQLRRTFEPIHAERLSTWFFSLGGRGAIRTLGSRLQNILVASAAVSVLCHLYGDRLRALVLANSPERLGDWRRGLQDCLGISRGDFGPDRGVILFESAEPLIQKADRLLQNEEWPLILIDETEAQINLAMLQFPLWLAFAPEPRLRPAQTSLDWLE